MVKVEDAFYDELARTKKILSDPDGTIPAIFFDFFARLINRFLRRDKRLSWWVSLVILTLLTQLPTLIVSNLLDENQRWKEYNIGFLWMGYIFLGLSAIVIARVGVFYLFRSMNQYVVGKFQNAEDLRDLQKILKHVWIRGGSIRRVIYFTIGFTVFWSFSFSAIYANFLGVKFIGYGLFVGTVVFGIITGPALFMEGWFFIFILRIGIYNFHLNDTAPVYSETVQRISRTITLLLYSFAMFIAFSTFAVSFNPVSGDFNIGAVFLVILIGWIPTTIYFAGSQVSINRIVTSAKWKTLGRIQEEIEKLHNGDLTNKDNVESINRLMDYHTRIRISPDSTLSVGTGLNFVNQLALPVMGVILANIDKLRQLLAP